MERELRQIISRMNDMGKQKQPFVFLLDFDLKHPLLFNWEDSNQKLLWKTPRYSNFNALSHIRQIGKWQVEPVSSERYRLAFGQVMAHILKGNTYLLNLTMPSTVQSDLELEDLLYCSQAPYQVLLRESFLCFSPEIFIRIENGRISSFPMKGTVDAAIPEAAYLLRNDRKELAEHATVVDLIRNDLSMVSENVEVARFCYLDEIRSNNRSLLQMSSEITGILPNDHLEHLGDIILRLLPAGSICGAPKQKTVEIIHSVENYDRGYYTGVFGIFDGSAVDSCVLIRYLEKQQGQFIYKSGGGITHSSSCTKEYQELINKIYVPVA
ncbi:MAG: aminodeoxychorismate synthase component I [Prolixibacteraceae bacterium]